MTKEERDRLLDIELGGGIKIRDASAIMFCQWAINKLNGMPAYDSKTVELAGLNSYPGRTMTEEQKLEILQKLIDAGVKL
jgi:hypothetical protein